MNRRERRQARRQTLGVVDPGTAQITRAALDPEPVDYRVQGKRLADMLIFGPLMLYAGLGKESPQWLKLGMVILGAGTILYQLAGFLETSQRQGGIVNTLTGMATGPIDRARAEALKRQLEIAERL